MLSNNLLAAFHRRSIRVRLVSLVLATLLPVSVLMAWFINRDIENSRQAAYANVTLIARGVAAQLDAILVEHADMLKALALEHQAQRLQATVRLDFSQFVRMHSLVVAVGARDLAGHNINATTRPLPDSVFQGSNWGGLALNSDALFVSDLQPGHGKQGWSVYLTHPLRDAQGARTGLVYVELDLLALNQRVMAAVPKNTMVPVIDRNDQILLRSGEPEVFIGKPTPKNVADAVRGKVSETFVTPDVSGTPRLYAVLTMTGSDWRVFAGVPEQDVLAGSIAQRNTAILVVLSTLVFSLGLGWFRAGTIRKPIEQLESDVARMMDDHQYRSWIRGPFEVEKIGLGLNTLLDQLDRQYRERQALTVHYASMLKNAREVIFLVDGEGRIVDASNAACDTYGYTEADLRQLNLTDLRADWVSKEATDADWAAASGTEGDLFETLHQRKDGSVFPVEVKSGLVEIDGQNYRQSFVRDISERKEAQAALMASDQFGRSTIDAVAAHICVIDPQGVIVAVNRPWTAFAEENLPPDAAASGDFPNFGLGYNYLAICDAAVGPMSEEAAPMAAGVRAVMRGDLAEFTLEYPCHSPTDQRWFLVRVTRFADGSGHCVIAHTKITERKNVELALLRRTRALQALSAVNRALVTVQNESDLLQGVCDVIVEKGGYRMAFVGIAEHDAEKTVRVVAHAGAYEGYMDQQTISWADVPSGRGPVGRAIRSGVTAVTHDIGNDPQMTPWRDAAMQRGYRSASVIPLVVDGQVMGVLTVYSSDPNAFDGPELELLEELSHDLAFGMATIRTTALRVALEAALLDSDEQFRSLIDQSPIGMHVLHDGVCTYANPRMEEIMGFGPGGLVGTRVEALVMPESRGTYDHAKELLETQGRTGNFLVTVKRKDGMVTTLGIQYVKGKFANQTASIGMAQDVSERERDKAEIQRYVQSLERTTEATLMAVSAMVEQRDPYTAGHERRVGELAAAIGKEMGLSDHQIKGLRLAGFVHDVGKIAVPAELLAKPTRLTDIEMALIRVHSQAGYDVLKGIEFPWPIAEVAWQHHERLDGSGYPRGLKGDAIILESRIMSVADVVESMSSHRPYRPGLGIGAALAEIDRHKGTHYDALVVAACKALFLERGYTIPV